MAAMAVQLGRGGRQSSSTKCSSVQPSSSLIASKWRIPGLATSPASSRWIVLTEIPVRLANSTCDSLAAMRAVAIRVRISDRVFLR